MESRKPRILMFNPSQPNIANGTQVTWFNSDSVVHTEVVISGPERFDAGYMHPGDNFTPIFPKPGTYDCMCNVHATFIFAKVVVA